MSTACMLPLYEEPVCEWNRPVVYLSQAPHRVARGLARVMSIRSFHAGFHVSRLLACRLLKLNSNTPGTASYKIDVARVSSAPAAVPASAPPQGMTLEGARRGVTLFWL
jgi:hypothetical protein